MRRPDLVVATSRLAAGAVLLACVGALPWLSRRDPAASVLRARYAELEPTPQALAAVRAELGLDGGPLATTLTWWSGVLRGDLGDSWVSGRPVGPGIVEALGMSATLTGAAGLVALVVATLLVWPTLDRVARDRPVRTPGPAGVVLTALPEFLLASALLVVVAVQLRWLPPYGWSTPAHTVLPALALGLPAGGLLGRLLADAVAGAAGERWVGVWRAAGAPGRTVAAGVLRRAGASVVDQVGLVAIGLLGGAVAVEQVFAVPGIGRLLLGAANAQDLPALQAGILAVAVVAVLVGTATALARRALLGGPLPPGALPPPPEPVRDGRGARRTLVAAVGALVVLLAAGLPRDPYATVHGRLAPPGPGLPLGADASGRDLLARVAHGTVGTLVPALVVVAAATVVALLLGFAADAVRGPVEVANATPPVVAGVLVAALAGPSLLGAAVAVLWVSWPPMVAHAAALVDEARAAPHVRWLPVAGASRVEVAVRHVLPLVVLPLVRHAVLRLPGVALALASLGFLGLGAQPPTPDWGLLLAEGIDYVERAPWATAAPAGALVLASVIAVACAALTTGSRRTRTRPAPRPAAAPDGWVDAGRPRVPA